MPTTLPRSAAQITPGKERPGDLVFNVSPVRKKYVGVTLPSRTTDATERQVSGIEQKAEDMRNAARGSDIAGLNIHMQNLGRKTVTSVKGELLIIIDDREAARLPFASKGKIGTGKVKRLAKLDIRKLEQPLRDRFLTAIEYDRAVARVRVERVEYEDGSVWQHP